MLSLNVAFWLFVIVFAIIGATRGWAKELLVIISVIIAVFLIFMIEHYLPFIREGKLFHSDANVFWLRAVILAVLVFLGYYAPSLPRLADTSRFSIQSLESSLLGFFLGIVNGYLIIGTLWFYLDNAGYPFEIVTAPVAGSAAGDAALAMVSWFLPAWFIPPMIYFGVAGAFAILVMLFI